MRLAKIEPLSESSFALTFADGTALRCGLNELADFSLRSGMEFDEEGYAALLDACTFYAVRRKAASLLSAKAMSAGELRRRLTEKGASPEHAEKAVDRLLELGAIDEEAYAAMVVRHYGLKGYGRKRVESELYRHMVPREYWEDALASLPDTDDTLDKLIRAKLRGGTPDRDEIRRLRDSLCRKGFGWEEVRAALARNLTELQDEDERSI